jgi:archaemetzincin
MKIGTVILATLIILSNCKKQPIFSSKTNNANKVIAIQPLGQKKINETELIYLRNQVSEFYHIRVIILKPQNIPASFSKAGYFEEIYSADSLITFLSKICNDTIVDVVGLTNADIFTIIKHTVQIHNKDTLMPEYKGIFGLGYVGGNSCIISDYRIMTVDEDLLNHRLRNVTFHEIGHNLGLTHCSNDTCLMSDQNGYTRMLDKNSGKYCDICKRKLN